MNHLYITTCDKTGGIYHYIFADGQLEFREMLPLDRAMYTVLSGGKYYTLLRDLEKGDGFGGLVSGEIGTDGKILTPCAPISTRGIVPCHLAVEGEDVYGVNYLSGNLVCLPDTVVTHAGKSIHPTRQTEPHTHFVTLSPDKQYVLCVDLGVDTVFVYDRSLHEISKAKVPAGSGCRHLVFSECGNYVYCVNELSNDVSVFSFGGGVLELLDTYPAIPEFQGKSTAAAIRLRDGFLYISHRGADCISTFKAEGPKLTLLANSPCGGSAPRDFDIVGNYLVCANEGGSVSVLKREAGIPHLVNAMDLPGDPLCVTVG